MSTQRPRQSAKRRNYVKKRKKKLTRYGVILILILFTSVIVSVFLVILTLPSFWLKVSTKKIDLNETKENWYLLYYSTYNNFYRFSWFHYKRISQRIYWEYLKIPALSRFNYRLTNNFYSVPYWKLITLSYALHICCVL